MATNMNILFGGSPESQSQSHVTSANEQDTNMDGAPIARQQFTDAGIEAHNRPRNRLEGKEIMSEADIARPYNLYHAAKAHIREAEANGEEPAAQDVEIVRETEASDSERASNRGGILDTVSPVGQFSFPQEMRAPFAASPSRDVNATVNFSGNTTIEELSEVALTNMDLTSKLRPGSRIPKHRRHVKQSSSQAVLPLPSLPEHSTQHLLSSSTTWPTSATEGFATFPEQSRGASPTPFEINGGSLDASSRTTGQIWSSMPPSNENNQSNLVTGDTQMLDMGTRYTLSPSESCMSKASNTSSIIPTNLPPDIFGTSVPSPGWTSLQTQTYIEKHYGRDDNIWNSVKKYIEAGGVAVVSGQRIEVDTIASGNGDTAGSRIDFARFRDAIARIDLDLRDDVIPEAENVALVKAYRLAKKIDKAMNQPLPCQKDRSFSFNAPLPIEPPTTGFGSGIVFHTENKAQLGGPGEFNGANSGPGSASCSMARSLNQALLPARVSGLFSPATDNSRTRKSVARHRPSRRSSSHFNQLKLVSFGDGADHEVGEDSGMSG